MQVCDEIHPCTLVISVKQKSEGTSNYVYDFTVPVEQQFDANGITVHNTDSVMVKFNGVPATMEGMRATFARGVRAAQYITDVTFGEHSEKVLEMEKTSFPYVLLKRRVPRTHLRGSKRERRV